MPHVPTHIVRQGLGDIHQVIGDQDNSYKPDRPGEISGHHLDMIECGGVMLIGHRGYDESAIRSCHSTRQSIQVCPFQEVEMIGWAERINDNLLVVT